MICYRDMTFCSQSEKGCLNTSCFRFITEEVRESAKTMGLGLGIGDLKQTGCGYRFEPDGD